MPKYECDKCGACCEHLIIEIDYLDILREPRIREYREPFRLSPGQVFYDVETDETIPADEVDLYMAGALLACGKTKPCPFLAEDKTCASYPTRPNVCVAMQAGSEQCQESRRMAGLSALEPVSELLS